MPQGEPTHALRFAIQLAEAEGYAECAAGLRAVLAHLERTQWRPIEEAPKDGRLIVIGGRGWWTPARWSEVNYVGVGDPTWITVDGHGTRTPTHYMIPVPPSPETP